MMDYRFKIIVSGALLCLSNMMLFSSDLATVSRGFDFDLVSFDDEDNYDIDSYLVTAGTDHISRAVNPVDVMVLLNLFEVPAVLQTPFFLKTNFLNKRTELDQPIQEPKRAQSQYPGKWLVGVNAYVRKTNRSNFTKNSDRLDSYLSISEEVFIQRLENVIERVNELNPLPEIDVMQIFSLFENMTVEERQAGFMLQCSKRWRYTTLRVMAPLYYLESNFSLTKEEQDAVAEQFGEEDKAFTKAHFISDKIGMGDTRIELDHTLLKRPSFTLRCGALATVPTAFTWGGGFLGSSFARPSTFPTFELDTIFNAIENPSQDSQQEAMAFIGDFLLDSFDRMAADLIDVPLGNRRHLGLGVYVRGKTPLRDYMNNSFAQRTSLTNRISLEWFLPATEKRFYIDKINEAAFAARDFESRDPVVAADNLQFLKEQAVSRLFLRSFSTHIVPGVIFRWSSQAQYKGEKFGFNLGTDFWLQNKPHFSSINVPSKILHEIDITKAKPPVARQSKVFGGIILKHEAERSFWFFSLNADATLNNKGLGQDYALSVNFEASF